MSRMVEFIVRTGREVSRFSVVGVVNTLVGVAIIFVCFRVLGLGLVLSNAIGYGIGLGLSFILNGTWTFGVSTYGPKTLAAYAVLVGVAFLANIMLVKALMVLSLAYWVAQVTGVVTYSGIVFLGLKYVVFQK